MVWHLKSQEMCAYSHLQPYIEVISALGPSEEEGSDSFSHLSCIYSSCTDNMDVNLQ